MTLINDSPYEDITAIVWTKKWEPALYKNLLENWKLQPLDMFFHKDKNLGFIGEKDIVQRLWSKVIDSSNFINNNVEILAMHWTYLR